MDWFDKMKSFFELIYFISGIFVPIILGYLTIKFTKESNMREKNSNKLHPKIIVSKRDKDDEKNVYEDLYIINERRLPLKKFNYNVQVFIELTVKEKSFKNLIIPVNRYYLSHTESLLISDRELIEANGENFKFFINLYREFIKIDEESKLYLVVNPEIKRLITIEYTNIHDENHKEYYLESGFTHIELKKEEVIELKEKLDVNIEDFYSLTAKELWKRFINLNKSNLK